MSSLIPSHFGGQVLTSGSPAFQIALLLEDSAERPQAEQGTESGLTSGPEHLGMGSRRVRGDREVKHL